MLKGAKPYYEGRPGESMEPLDFGAIKDHLETTHNVQAKDELVMSAALYPKVM